MKEITMIITCEITTITTVSDNGTDELVAHKDDVEAKVREIIKRDLHSDDVNILNCQLFVRDVPVQ